MKNLDKIIRDFKNPTKYADVKSVDEYFKLPVKDRTRWGFWYKIPRSLPWFGFDNLDRGWDEFDARIKKEYPVQFLVRELFTNTSYELRRLRDKFDYWWAWAFDPQHRDIAAAIPRNWQDLSELIVDVNFAIIKSFYKEAKESYVDWDGCPLQKDFIIWLENAYNYIIVVRPSLEKELSESYPNNEQRKLPYEQAYGKVNKLEKQIEDMDTKIIQELAVKRGFFWT